MMDPATPAGETAATGRVSGPAPAGDRRQLSFFEFWPTWLMYLPVAGLWLLLAMRYRSLTLPLLANPQLKLAGMVGARKSQLFCLFRDQRQPWLLPWATHRVSDSSSGAQLASLEESMRQRGLSFPVVAKPEIGCRGAGVKLITDEQALRRYLEDFPTGASLLVQKLASWEPEAGIFYLRYPGESSGRIVSMAFKHTPYVVGDGVRTLRQLIEADPRAGQVSHLYFPRFREKLDTVIEKDEPFRLLFSASHCRGAIFRNASEHVTDALTQRLDAMLTQLPDFHYGRLDVKYRCLDALRRGEDLEIVEINGASSEALHIWDRGTRFGDAVKMLLTQYRHLFALGAINRKKGYRSPGARAFWRAWRLEKNLTKQYPAND